MKNTKIISPPRLRSGDTVRVIAPARSLSLIDPGTREIAQTNFKKLRLNLTFGKNAEKSDSFLSSSIEDRVEDIHEAFFDPNVKAIFAVIGGFNSNQLLNYIDYDLIKSHPKIFCGYSDITALGNAIFAKTGVITYSGPVYSSFGMVKGFDYTLNHIKKCFFQESPFLIEPSDMWSDDPVWFLDQENRSFEKNNGWKILNPASFSGNLIGGHLMTLLLLQGTEFMPSLDGAVLFLEEVNINSTETLLYFERGLQSLLQQSGGAGLKGILIGRFQKESKITDEKLISILSSKKELRNIPIIYNMDFGHTYPLLTLPVGGKISVEMLKGSDTFKVQIVEF